MFVSYTIVLEIMPGFHCKNTSKLFPPNGKLQLRHHEFPRGGSRHSYLLGAVEEDHPVAQISMYIYIYIYIIYYNIRTVTVHIMYTSIGHDFTFGVSRSDLDQISRLR